MKQKKPFLLRSLLVVFIVVTFLCVTIFIGSISFVNSFTETTIQRNSALNYEYFQKYIERLSNELELKSKSWKHQLSHGVKLDEVFSSMTSYVNENDFIIHLSYVSDENSFYSDPSALKLTENIDDYDDVIKFSKAAVDESYLMDFTFKIDDVTYMFICDLEKIVNKIVADLNLDDLPIVFHVKDEFVYQKNISEETLKAIDFNKLKDTITINDTRYLVSYIESERSSFVGVYLIEQRSSPFYFFNLDVASVIWLLASGLLIIASVIILLYIRQPINDYLNNIFSYHGSKRKLLPKAMLSNPIINELDEHIHLVGEKVAEKKREVHELSKQSDDYSLQLGNYQTMLSSTLLQRREMEDELAGYYENYKSILHLLPDNIFIIKGNGIIEYINENFLQMLNFENEELINKPLNRFILDADSCFDLLVKRDFDGIEISFKQKNDGDIIKLSVKTQRIFIENELQAILCVCRDVSFVQRMNFDYYSKNRELYIVNEISKIMTVNVDVERILQNITAKISALLDLKGCTIRFYENDQLELVAYEGYQSDIIKRHSISVNNTHAGLALMEGKIYIIRNSDDLVFEEQRLDDAINNSDTLVFLPLSTDDKKFGVLSVASDHEVEYDDLVLLESISTNATIALEKTILFKQLKENYFKTVEALLTAIEINTTENKGHIHHVANIARLIGELFYFTSSELDDIYIAGLLHDIDRIAMKDSSTVTEIERAELRREIIEKIGLNESIQNGVVYHKSNYDLSEAPYPINEQPFYAKIIQISNEYEKKYRELGGNPTLIDSAYNEIAKEAGSKFAPEMVRVLGKIVSDHKSKLEKAISFVE